MKISSPNSKQLPKSKEKPLLTVVREQFQGMYATSLFTEFFRASVYRSGFVRRVIGVARNPGLDWNLRCAAVLMLEHQALLLWGVGGYSPKSDSLLAELGLLQNGAIPEAVLHDGYSTTDRRQFTAELHQRLSRLNYLHHSIAGLETKPEKLLDFIYVSRRPCKLSLARYLFQPSEVAQWILTQVRSSEGLPKSRNSVDYHGQAVPESRPPQIGEFDKKVSEYLRDGLNVLWVADRTSSELNSLVEYPLKTVALVIKPPGSDLEFEVKRAGMRGDRAFDVVHQRNGKPLPVAHRLQGGSYGFMLDYERYASDRFSEIYRGVHAAEPPMSRFLGITAIARVPSGIGHVQLVQYLSDHNAFGEGFDEMREQMRICVEAFEGNNRREEFTGAVGLTTRFIVSTVPNQAWIAGTSSYRLDRTADLLSPHGPEIYFGEGLGRTFTKAEARRFANEILEEVLGVFDPPDTNSDTFDEYVGAALTHPPNRAAADTAYLDAAADIGLYWGTLLGVGGSTEGESFVSRNVGLKSRWQGGRWRVRICFMDHDCMGGLGIPGETPQAARTIEGMRKDGDWIGDAPGARGEFACLREIYRVSAEVQTVGEEVFRKQVAVGYRATRRAMQSCEQVRSMFDAEYVATLDVRDEVIRLFLSSHGSEAAIKRWRKAAKARLSSTLYSTESIPEFLDTVVRNTKRLEHYSFLYESR